MNWLVLPILYFLSGFFMKISDDFYDEKNYRYLAILFGLFCGVVTSFAAISNFDAMCIFIAILLGNIIALKVDGMHHIVTMFSFLIIFLIFKWNSIFTGSFSFNFVIIMVICIFGAFLDELGNDNEKVYSLGKFYEVFFDYRCSMKVAILVLSLFGYLNILSFVYFICFEIAYEFARIIFKKFLL